MGQLDVRGEAMAAMLLEREMSKAKNSVYR